MNPSTSAQALQNLNQYQSTMQTPQSALQTADSTLGVDQAKQQVTGLQGAINNTTSLLNQVAPSVEGRTQNSLVTSAQAGKQIENEQAPIQSNLSQDTQDYNTANSNYTDLESQAENQANAEETSQSNQLSYLQNIYNDLYTQEQNAAQAKAQQDQFSQTLAEQEREANLSSSSSGVSSPSLASLLGGATGSAAAGGNLTGGMSTQQADSAVKSLIDTNDASTIINTIGAIQKSAGYGNTYDQAKLQLLERYMPGWFSNGSLNTGYLQRLASSNELKNKI